VIALQQQSGRLLIVFVELKSHRGLASKTQKQVRAELLAAGVLWWMARSAHAAMTALYRSGVAFRRPWEPPPLQPWERFPIRTRGCRKRRGWRRSDGRHSSGGCRVNRTPARPSLANSNIGQVKNQENLEKKIRPP
jgi:hypothetical protein